MSAKGAAIRAIYAQVDAPEWAATNLDALADVLRDLTWLPQHQIWITVPELGALPAADRAALLEVLAAAVAESASSPRPVHLRRRVRD